MLSKQKICLFKRQPHRNANSGFLVYRDNVNKDNLNDKKEEIIDRLRQKEEKEFIAEIKREEKEFITEIKKEEEGIIDKFKNQEKETLKEFLSETNKEETNNNNKEETNNDNNKKNKEEDAKTDSLFKSDEEQLLKRRKKKIRFYLIAIGVVLVIVSFGFYYYTIALSQSLIENFWVPEDQFNKLSTSEILTRITQLGAFVDFIELRDYIYAQEWPLMMCIQSLKHRDPIVRESVLHVLTKMADYDNYRQVIGKKVNFGAVFNEINSRNGFEKDDIAFHTFISQFMHQKNVQRLALANSGQYFSKLIDMLASEDPQQKGVAIISLSKLAENPEANKLMSTIGVFHIVQSLYDPYEPTMTLVNDGSSWRFKVRERAAVLLNALYDNPSNRDLITAEMHPGKAKELPSMLASLTRDSNRPYLLGQLIFQTILAGTVLAVPWGYIRYILKERMNKVPFSKNELARAFTRGSSKAVAGTVLFISAYQSLRLFNDEYTAKIPSSLVQASTQSGLIMFFYLGLLFSRRFLPFSFLPSTIILMSNYFPTPSKTWDSQRESAYTFEDYLAEKKRLEDQKA